MKKFIWKTVLFLLAASLFIMTACDCGGNGWSKDNVTLKEWGEVKSNGAFVAETENYVYYINGAGDSTADNSFGAPVKGALVAAKKSDVKDGKESVEKCIVVPKLFVATDYNMGVFIKGDYVYYATPSTDKTSSGSVASGEIQFMKTKLDGTGSEKLLKAGAISDQYRIFESGDAVYIAVYDSANTRLLCYNTSDKTQVEIAKTDEKTSGDESLNAYFFADAKFAADGVVVFTTTVYKEKYDENAAAKDSSYSRATESYNKVYVYKAGEEKAKLVLDGTDAKNTFTLTQVSGEYLYYTKTVKGLTDETPAYAVKIADLYGGTAADRTYNTDYVTSTNLVVSPSEVYVLGSDAGTVKRASLFDNAKANEKKVATLGASVTLLFIDGGYVYYTNENTVLLRMKLDDVSAKCEQISDGAVNSSWYAPKIIDGSIYYVDATAEGAGYVKAVSLSDDNLKKVDSTGKKPETDDDIDHYYFENRVSLGILTESDTVTVVSEKINAITTGLNGGKLVFDTDYENNVVKDEGGLPVIAKIGEIRTAYDAFNKDNKKQIEESYATFIKYEKAYEISRTLYKLNNFDKLSAAEKDALKADFDAAKAAFDAIKSDDYTVNEIKALCVENLMWYYQTAETYFA